MGSLSTSLWSNYCHRKGTRNPSDRCWIHTTTHAGDPGVDSPIPPSRWRS